MPSFNTAVITKKGIALSAKTLNGKTLKFTKAAMGSGEYNEAEKLENITDLRQKRQEIEFNYMEIVSENQVMLRSVFSNKELEAAYKIREFGVYAEDPDEGEILYLICTAVKGQEDTMPLLSENGLVTFTMETTVSVSSTANIVISDTSGGYALIEDLKALEKKVDNHTAEADKKYALKTDLDDLMDRVEELLANLPSGMSGIIFAEEALSSEATTEDNKAEYKCLQKTSEAEAVIFTAQTDEAKFGAYSCAIRAKVSDIEKSGTLLEIETAYVGNERTVLKTVTVSPDMFDAAGAFQSFGFVFDFAGEKTAERKLEVKGTIKQIDGPVTLTIDYIMLNYAIPAIYALT